MAMAVVPGTYTTSFRQLRQRDEHRAYRLPQNHVADIRDIARGIEESNVGVCCKYLVDTMSGAGHSDIDGDGYVNHLDAVERFYDMYPLVDRDHPELVTWRSRIQRCRRALAAMRRSGHHQEVSILHVVYGYPDPFTREFTKKVSDELGELASLVKYTDVVEAKRQAMAREEASRASRIPPELIDEEGERRRAIDAGIPPTHGAALVDFLRHKDCLQHALAAISSTDAVRANLLPCPERMKGESDDRYAERREAHDTRQEVFVSQMKVDASKMLSHASKVFHAAWLSVP